MPLRDIADAWAAVYANSAAARSVVTFSHLGALVVGGGSAIAADLGTVGALRGDDATLRGELDRLRATHRRVTLSLAVVVLSGLLLALADVDAYLASVAFWIKMALFAALLVNGAFVVAASTAAGNGAAGARRRLRWAALASLMLWLATTLLGTVVPNAL